MSIRKDTKHSLDNKIEMKKENKKGHKIVTGEKGEISIDILSKEKYASDDMLSPDSEKRKKKRNRMSFERMRESINHYLLLIKEQLALRDRIAEKHRLTERGGGADWHFEEDEEEQELAELNALKEEAHKLREEEMLRWVTQTRNELEELDEEAKVLKEKDQDLGDAENEYQLMKDIFSEENLNASYEYVCQLAKAIFNEYEKEQTNGNKVKDPGAELQLERGNESSLRDPGMESRLEKRSRVKDPGEEPQKEQRNEDKFKALIEEPRAMQQLTKDLIHDTKKRFYHEKTEPEVSIQQTVELMLSRLRDKGVAITKPASYYLPSVKMDYSSGTKKPDLVSLVKERILEKKRIKDRIEVVHCQREQVAKDYERVCGRVQRLSEHLEEVKCHTKLPSQVSDQTAEVMEIAKKKMHALLSFQNQPVELQHGSSSAMKPPRGGA